MAEEVAIENIAKKYLFNVMGVSKMFKYDSVTTEIPQFWTEHYQTGKGKFVCGIYGISIYRAKDDKIIIFVFLLKNI